MKTKMADGRVAVSGSHVRTAPRITILSGKDTQVERSIGDDGCVHRVTATCNHLAMETLSRLAVPTGCGLMYIASSSCPGRAGGLLSSALDSTWGVQRAMSKMTSSWKQLAFVLLAHRRTLHNGGAQ